MLTGQVSLPTLPSMTTPGLKRAVALALLFGLLVALAGCVAWWAGKPLFQVEPAADVWIHHAQPGGSNLPPTRPE